MDANQKWVAGRAVVVEQVEVGNWWSEVVVVVVDIDVVDVVVDIVGDVDVVVVVVDLLNFEMVFVELAVVVVAYTIAIGAVEPIDEADAMLVGLDGVEYDWAELGAVDALAALDAAEEFVEFGDIAELVAATDAVAAAERVAVVALEWVVALE